MTPLKHLLCLSLSAVFLPSLAQTATPPEFTRCIEGLQGAARAAGVQEATYSRLTAGPGSPT